MVGEKLADLWRCLWCAGWKGSVIWTEGCQVAACHRRLSEEPEWWRRVTGSLVLRQGWLPFLRNFPPPGFGACGKSG